jgi:hypothetical protein
MKVETFAQLVEAIQRLPTSHRKTAFALECNAVAEAFQALRNDVSAAAKTSTPVKAAQPEKQRMKCGRN